jgi:LuxR family maltose regulon positive regulatory protein
MSTAAIALTRAHIQLAQGELNATLHWALEHKLTFEGQPNYFMYSDLLFLCRVMLESLQTRRNQYNPDNVLRILDWLEPCALKNGLVQRSIAIHALRAMTVHWQGKSQESMDLLAKALALAESEGYLRSLIDQGPLLYPLLGQLHMILGSQSTDTHWEKQAYLLPYLSRLLEACPFSKKSEEPAPGYGVLPEALSERELQLLRLVAEGRSNQEIAEQLVIAISTVKSHLNTIFSKMGVKNRTEAVARGRAQHLV